MKRLMFLCVLAAPVPAIAAQSAEWCQANAQQQQAIMQALAQPGIAQPQKNLKDLKDYIAQRGALSDPAAVALQEQQVAEAERNIEVLKPAAEKSEQQIGPARDTLTDLQIDYEKAKAALDELKDALAKYTTGAAASDPATVKQLKDKVAQGEKDLLARDKVVQAHQENLAMLNATAMPLTDARAKLKALQDAQSAKRNAETSLGAALKAAIPGFDPLKPELVLNDVQAKNDQAVQAAAVQNTQLAGLKKQAADGGCPAVAP